MSNNHAEEISQLSLSFLHILREIARTDPEEASIYFGVGEDVIQKIAQCDIADIQNISRMGIMLFTPRIKSKQMRALFSDPSSSTELARATAMALAK